MQIQFSGGPPIDKEPRAYHLVANADRGELAGQVELPTPARWASRNGSSTVG
jgi:hypothetical protein